MKLGADIHHLSGNCWKKGSVLWAQGPMSCSNDCAILVNFLAPDRWTEFEPKLIQVLLVLGR